MLEGLWCEKTCIYVGIYVPHSPHSTLSTAFPSRLLRECVGPYGARHTLKQS